MVFNRPASTSAPDASLLAGPAGGNALNSATATDAAGNFEQIVQLHSSRVFNFVYQMTRHRQDAEDLVQQTFIKAYNNLHRFDGTRPIINWLLTIARRSTLNHFRSSKRWEEMPESAASNEPSPASTAEHCEEKENLWTEARRLLSQREFEVLWLRFGEDRSVEETARISGLTQTHVKVIVFRAKQQLMKAHVR
ncbi:MAG TPA: sigma-70 family RNA polymerase sigma factor [Opitutus sp.]|nr:sigma-70 family RNA polymerase sigma factor [Opitutus sp.]